MMDVEKMDEYYRNFWASKSDPSHHHSTEDWFEKYYRELSFFCNNKGTIVDCGCGSGDLMVRMCKDFEFVIGIDYSSSMLSAAKTKLSDLECHNYQLNEGSIVNVHEFVQSKADAIFSNAVIQYLSPVEIENYVFNCRQVLKKGGKIIMMNIPNRNFSFLYYSSVYHSQLKKDFSEQDYTKLLLQKKWTQMKQRLKQTLTFREKGFDIDKLDAIGYWHTPKLMAEIAQKNAMDFEYFNSLYVPYGYRFHATLTLP